jgi:ribosomal protein S4
MVERSLLLQHATVARRSGDHSVPERADIQLNANEQLVVELYSK